MDPLAIPDRRRLRRKLTFWRIIAIAAIILVVAALSGLAGWTGGFGTDMTGRPHIARVEVSGLITADDDLLDRLEKIRDDNSVKGLVVAIESPGGTTYGGERLFEAVRAVAAEKPVVAEVRGLAASAGYMVATAADHIVAGEASLVGSIGVLFQYGNVTELLDRIGVSVDAIKSSPLKAQPSPFEPTTPDAEAMIRSLVDDTYDWFVDLVTERRGFTREETLELADGRVFTGRQASENGLIDTLGGEAEITAYFDGHSVDGNLPIIDWKAEGRGSFLFGKALGALAAEWFGQVTGIELPFGALAERQLFLDGMMSVWQVGDGKLRERGSTP